MTDPNKPVDGPYPIQVGKIPTGITLDVTAFVTDLVVELAQGALHSDLCDIAEMYETAAAHDGHAREQLLVEELVDRLATRIPVYGVQCYALADRIRELAEPVALSSQQNRRAS
ncbi:hypothetical protein ABZ070_19365 [Streptomyces sp. NPDC006283]|uniref:hypothetical protein n=1 Tax=Streptomyces sp. NPDC006283 TaxID=3156741 RepID=UPI0033A9972B